MKISGFTFSKNGSRLYYPIIESIRSIIDLVDEFVVVLGDSETDDTTEFQIKALNNPKIKIIKSVWDLEKFSGGTIYAHQTNLAKNACTGDWLFYLQGDEVVHERYLDKIKATCEQEYERSEVEGILFGYKHFWGDYKHYHSSRCWYPFETRIIRNRSDIYSWGDAQTFRRIPDFDGSSYRKRKDTFRLHVVKADAEIYHYGWVRPTYFMCKKQQHANHYYSNQGNQTVSFDYGPLGRLSLFNDTHPAVMKDWISKFDWADELNYTKDYMTAQPIHRHDFLRNRIITQIELFLFGEKTFGRKNYELLRK
tara:strand:+ start:2204 stop:3130 length:927 start_codon:yes stop_codon:yes gene_type:complete